MARETEVTGEQIILEIGKFGLDVDITWSGEWRAWFTLQTREAESIITNATGRDFNPATDYDDYVLYSRGVRMHVAKDLMRQIHARESGSMAYEIDGGYSIRTDVTSQNLKSIKLELDREVNKIVDRLKQTKNPQFRVVVVQIG